MNLVFADTQFFVGRVNPRDQWHKHAREAEAALTDPHYITTESVLTEVMAYFCDFGPELRLKAAVAIELILADPNTEVISISHEIFLQGVDLYKKRPDKSYSLTDCISINICRSREIGNVLSHDRHFSQEGLNILMQNRILQALPRTCGSIGFCSIGTAVMVYPDRTIPASFKVTEAQVSPNGIFIVNYERNGDVKTGAPQIEDRSSVSLSSRLAPA